MGLGVFCVVIMLLVGASRAVLWSVGWFGVMGLIIGFNGWSRMFRVCRLVLNTESGA